jgi:hypothetical protein
MHAMCIFTAIWHYNLYVRFTGPQLLFTIDLYATNSKNCVEILLIC